MILYAERFTRMEDAKARWATLEQRLAQHRDCEAIAVSAWLDGEPHVFYLGLAAPDGVLDDPTGTVRMDIPPSVWLRLAQRHESRRPATPGGRLVIRRALTEGIQL